MIIPVIPPQEKFQKGMQSKVCNRETMLNGNFSQEIFAIESRKL